MDRNISNELLVAVPNTLVTEDVSDNDGLVENVQGDMFMHCHRSIFTTYRARDDSQRCP